MNDQHYLKAVTELSDTQKIVADCDIYSKSGMKLVAEGIQITSRMYDQLVHHTLLPSLDNALSMENVLNSDQLLADVIELLERSDRLTIAAQIVNQHDSYTKIIQHIKLPTPMAFKLTVAKEKFPRIYQQSLLFMLLSVYLAHCEGMSLKEKEGVAVAALFHDIGLLHIDPKLLEPTHVMTVLERRHLYAHPLLAYMMLCEFPELPKWIANAVLEHHERMDGSGYPRGLPGSKISRYGQILAVVELIAKVFDGSMHQISWGKLDIMLKMNYKQYGGGLIGHLNIFRADAENTQTEENESEHLIERMKLISKLFSDFNQLSDPQSNSPVYEFAQDRLVELRLALFSTGVDPRNPESLIQMFMDDPACVTEFAPIIDETIWQFKSLLLEISRQWPEGIDSEDDVTENPEHIWLSHMRLVLATDRL